MGSAERASLVAHKHRRFRSQHLEEPLIASRRLLAGDEIENGVTVTHGGGAVISPLRVGDGECGPYISEAPLQHLVFFDAFPRASVRGSGWGRGVLRYLGSGVLVF